MGRKRTMARDTYTKQAWENLPSQETPVSAERLDHIEQGIKTAMDNRALKEIYGDESLRLGGGSMADGRYSVAAGINNKATGDDSHAEGQGTTASGKESHAEGIYTTASGIGSHAEGNGTKATSMYSHSEGGSTTANGQFSHAEGDQTVANGVSCHAEGYKTEANIAYSHAEGDTTKANKVASHAEGMGTIADSFYQHVQGKYNVADANGLYAHIVGGGTSDTDRKNIYTLDWAGNAYYAGDVTNGAGVSMNEINDKIKFMTYDETTTELNSQKAGEINKIPNIYAIRDWCKTMLNPPEGA